MSQAPGKIPKTVWALGFVSLFMDISSEIVHGLLPVFLVSALGASYTTVGLIEGFGEATTLFLKVFSGPLSDWWGKRKPLVLFGYTLSVLSKPLFALAPNPSMVFGARLSDRVGKGIRDAPRDALIADVVDENNRGQAFGLRQSLDTVGAFVGPLLAIFLMSVFANDYRTVFWFSAIPGVIAIALLVFGVKETFGDKPKSEKKLIFRAIREFRPAFWVVAIVGGFFQLARFSEAFLILRAENVGLALGLAPLVLVVMNIVYAFSAYPLGRLSDSVRREWFLIAGFLFLILANVALAFGNDLVWIFAGITLWGFHLGLTQGVLAALVADTCPAEYRGTAYGIFNFFSAVALLLASAGAGFLWDRFGPSVTFLVSGALAIVGAMMLLLFQRVLKLE